MYIHEFASHCTFRVVKEEIIEDESSLPNAKGRIVCWVSCCLQNI